MQNNEYNTLSRNSIYIYDFARYTLDRYWLTKILYSVEANIQNSFRNIYIISERLNISAVTKWIARIFDWACLRPNSIHMIYLLKSHSLLIHAHLSMNVSNSATKAALLSGLSSTWSTPLALNNATSAGSALPVTPAEEEQPAHPILSSSRRYVHGRNSIAPIIL